MSAQMDGWANFADYLSLNKDASQRQLQAALDEQAPNAEMIRGNAQRQYANAGHLGFEGNDINQGHGGEQEKLMMDYGSFVEGLSDPDRLKDYFDKHGAGGNSALDAGLASVAGAGQIQEAQKGLNALQNYVTEKGVDAQARYATGQQAKERALSQEQARQAQNARWVDLDKQGSQRQAQWAKDQRARDIAFADSQKGADNPFAQPGADPVERDRYYSARIKEFDPLGQRVGSWKSAPSESYAGAFPSWAKKPGGF